MFLSFIKLIGLTFLSELLQPKPEVQHEKPAGFNEFGIPTASVGRPIPVVFGKVRQRAPNVLWYGDYSTIPQLSQQKVKGIFKSKTVNQQVGHRYFVGMHLGLAHAGVTGVHRIWMGEKVAWSGSITPPGTASINDFYFFGGPTRGGSLSGNMSFWPGGLSQSTPPYLAGKLTQPPAFRGITSAIWEGGEVGERPALDALSFELSRYPSLLGLGAVGEDANPAEIAWETLLNTTWGLGGSSDFLDQASFTAAGTTLASEGFGLSLLWDQAQSIGDFLSEITRHVDGVIYPDLRTAKMRMDLARDDYDEDTIPVLNPQNSRLLNHSLTGYDETVNELSVVYTSRLGSYAEDAIQAFDRANLVRQGGQKVSSRVQYPGVQSSSLASALASRDLRALSTPMYKGSSATNRVSHQLVPGGVFKLVWPPEGITGLVCRITRIRPGAPGSSGIEIDWVQDVFSLGSAIFAGEPATEWVDPVSDAEVIVNQDADEVPYLLLARDDGSAASGTIDPSVPRVMVVAERPNGSTLEASIQTRMGSDPYVDRGILGQMTPTGTLVNAYPKETDAIDGSDTLIVENLTDFELLEDASADLVAGQVRNFAFLDAEVIAWETITDNLDGTYTLGNVWRGILDTVQADHSAGARIWFASEGMATTQDTYTEPDVVDVRLVPRTARSELAAGDATPMIHTMTRRAYRPYVPGRLRVNGSEWPETITGELSVTWAHRDRATTLDIVSQDQTSLGPEAGTTYTLRIYDGDDVLLRTETGITGTSYTYDQADEESDAGELQGVLRFTLHAVRDGVESHQYHERTVQRVGWGLGWGVAWGEGS